MIRVLLTFLLGAAAGIGGLEAYGMVVESRAPSMLQAIESATGTPEPDSTPGPVEEATDTVTLAIDTVTGQPIDSLGVIASAPVAAGDTVVTGGVPAPGAATLPAPQIAPEDRLEPRRLAKLFGSMQAREAARVLERMSDGDIQIVLNQLADRQAAGILSNLTPERAAQLTQVVLRGERNPQ